MELNRNTENNLKTEYDERSRITLCFYCTVQCDVFRVHRLKDRTVHVIM